MPQKDHPIQPKFTFLELCVQLFPPISLQYHPQMLLVLLLISRIDEDVINEYDHELIQEGKPCSLDP